MTAVASPPSVQSGSRLGWYSTGDGGEGALSSVNAEEVSRMFMPRKHVQRSNSSSSLSSSSSTATVTNTQSETHAGQNSSTEVGTWSSKKKPIRSPWFNTKAEAVAGVTNLRSQPVPAFSSGPTASSTMSAIHQPPSIVPSQHMLQSSQQNGIRQTNGQSADPPAILTLTPMNGTFEKKQINVPFFSEVLRIGRQTNAKTVPTPVNGFFDSKVLSRQHAEIWADKTGKIWIRDVKSSNGTFVNGHRLSPENRESEPHELRENDTLELGIDIVSEDQNTIVHHKVSAKVEHAGLYGTTPNILDLNFGDLDPASGGGLLPSPLSQPLSHLRGRSSSNLSTRSSQSVASSQFNAVQQQRQMNYWNSPISVEQVVKRLTGELKQAKQQSQDLRQTDDFLNAIMKPGYAEKEKATKPSLENGGPRQINGRPKMPRVDSFSRFSDPPAPPPQQPLPEKPDAPRSGMDAFSPLKRSDTDKQKPVSTTSSPVSRDSSQILSLLEALSSAKREIDVQSVRMKELEDILHQEKAARESAEEKVKKLEMRSSLEHAKQSADGSTDSLPDNNSETQREHEDVEKAEQPNGSIPPSEASADPEATKPDSYPDVNTAQLQKRLETMMEEMEEMRKQVASFKDRAEKAENENAHSRKSLAELIEDHRRERDEKATAAAAIRKTKLDVHGQDTAKSTSEHSSPAENGAAEPSKKGDASVQHSDPASLKGKEMDAAATALATQWHRRGFLEEASPFASMFGVVLLGVGLMAYLNGWQKMDK
ncbi:uncharacterized protein N7459_008636 [Penicillium hispanicum]|uniref:FHA domain-containing protein n=1 Tax=Penicillium cinerascens TaxID=70096 RepID=A0A9W9MDU1_9EURO|nr:uncharacterized protein N7459_008636 [Penicillium hispanicum]XP_058307233.1 uncharacterized protein N7498_007922 [Penicillium cinerascens]KAJ5198805.1 hypothetical protein N7498_007922 [Penicillium cinerascens]KAJ5574209.1 hypothetical protein N7459_008636 [Penicillium hispanicum]